MSVEMNMGRSIAIGLSAFCLTALAIATTIPTA